MIFLFGNLDANNQTITFDGSGDKTCPAISDASLDIVVNKSSSGSVSFSGTCSFDEFTVSDGKAAIGSNTITCDNTVSIADGKTLEIGTGTFNSDGTFNANISGIIDFTGAGKLILSSSVTSLGALDVAAGTVEYDGGAQDVLADAYYNLEIDQVPRHHKGTVTVAGDMTVQSAATYAVAATTTTVTGTSDINGTTSISTGTYNADGLSDVDGTISITGTGKYDADAEFNATNGNVTFTGAGRLECSNTVTSLGTLSTGAGTVEYDGGAQDVLADAYYNLEIDQSGTKTSQGTVTVAGDMTVQSAAAYAVAATTTTVTGTSDINGTTSISTGTYNADGLSDVDGTISITGTGKYDADAEFNATMEM